ncbi:hypothetical protein [Peribacillus muralis]|uniref:hypothetical protein n=1 Tax=Peribacillus muralis TaxID=264697 RepID=UPI003D026594
MLSFRNLILLFGHRESKGDPACAVAPGRLSGPPLDKANEMNETVKYKRTKKLQTNSLITELACSVKG